MEYKEQVVLITGAGRGLGRVLAKTFAREGARVVLASRTAEEIEEAAREIREEGGQAIAVPTDVASEESVTRLLDAIGQTYGRLDVLINNAALFRGGSITETTLEDWNAQISVNLTGAFLCCKHALPLMAGSGGGSIVSISSGAASKAFPGYGAYSASKGALISFNRVLAAEAAPLGIRATALVLGLTDTKNVRDRVSVPREEMLQPEQVAEVVLFLASEKGSGFSGTAVDYFGKHI